MERIDATGKACPQPVMLAKTAVEHRAREIEVTVDNDVAASNVSRFLQSQGYDVKRSGSEKTQVVFGEKAREAGPEPVLVCEAPSFTAFPQEAFLFLSKNLGSESPELGEALMKAFLGVLAQRTPQPETIALMNGGVFLALTTSSACSVLQDMAAKGVKILVCGTCTKHFGITEQVAVGQISNMFEITEAMLAATKSLTIG